MWFDCFRELVRSLLALSIAHVSKHTLKTSSGHAGNQKHTWVGYPSASTFAHAYGTSFCQVDMDSRSRHRRAGTPKPLANVLCRSARKLGRGISSPYLSSSHCRSRCTSMISLFKMVSRGGIQQLKKGWSFPVLGAEKSRQRTFRLS